MPRWVARRGAKVVVNDLGGAVDGSGGSSEAAEKLSRKSKPPAAAMSNGSSVTDDAGVANMVQQTMDSMAALTFVNNAGVLRDKSFAKMEIADFDFVVDVHLFGCEADKAVWPIMKEQGMAALWLPLHHRAFTETSASQIMARLSWALSASSTR